MSAPRGALRKQPGWMPAIALLFAAMLCLCFPGAARAEWREASSTHFVIYADDTESELREFAEDLERFHSALEYLSQTENEAPSPSNRVTIYAGGSARPVQRIAGTASVSLGSYLPRAGRSAAFVPKLSDGTRRIDHSMFPLLAAYSRHFFVSRSKFPMPRWFFIGSSEFFATASFERDGGLIVGMPANHRASELRQLRDIPIEEILDLNLYLENRGRSYDGYQGWSWLLYHYLMFAEDRKGQMENYARNLIQPVPPLDAARAAFGDLNTLERELRSYLRKSKILSIRLPPALLKVEEIKIRTLPEGEARIMPLRVQSRRGVSLKQAVELLPHVRKVAAAYPGDTAVQAALAEAEFDAGNDAEAVASADAALAADGSNVDAYVQKGFALFRMAQTAEDKDAAYKAAMGPFLALNRLENDHPLPLWFNYRTFIDRGEKPDKLAVQGLQRAVDLARFDLSLQRRLAFQQIRDGDYEQAKLNLAPIAYQLPSESRAAQSAQKLIKRLNAGGPPVSEEELAAFISAEEELSTDQDSEGGSSGEETEESD